MKSLKFLFMLTLSVFIISCSDDDDNGTDPNDNEPTNNGGLVLISDHDEAESHQNGANCVTCHKSGGAATNKGWFVISGSVYKEDKDSPLTDSEAKVLLYTGPNGTGEVKYEIEIDDRGNFYTTKNLNYQGLYPSVISADGTRQMFMPVALSSTGVCSSCHNQRDNDGNLIAPKTYLED